LSAIANSIFPHKKKLRQTPVQVPTFPWLPADRWQKLKIYNFQHIKNIFSHNPTTKKDKADLQNQNYRKPENNGHSLS